MKADHAHGRAWPRYDDLLDTLACQEHGLDPVVWDDLVDRLAAYDVTYLAGGSADAAQPSPYHGPADVDVRSLALDLARAPEPRLRDALVALLLLHPAYAVAVREVANSLAPNDPAWASLTARLLVASALGRRHQTALARELPGYAPIDVTDLVAAYQLPQPEQEDGYALLNAVQRLISARLPAVDYVGGWEDVAQHTLRELHGRHLVAVD